MHLLEAQRIEHGVDGMTDELRLIETFSAWSRMVEVTRRGKHNKRIRTQAVVLKCVAAWKEWLEERKRLAECLLTVRRIGARWRMMRFMSVWQKADRPEKRR